MRKMIAGLLISFCCSTAALAASGLESAIQEGTVNGNIRMHYNLRDYTNRPDASAFALGGGLRAETGAMGLAKIGVGFYTAQDLDLNNEDPARVDGRMGSDLEVLGEAYVTLSGWDSSMTLGRQKIVTPFATPLDIFLAPFTYEGVSIKYTGISNLTLEADYINTIKSAGSDEFVDVGVWSTMRLGVDVAPTSGTLMLGANYTKDALAVQAWHYHFADLFNAQYLQAGYNFSDVGVLKPFVAAQFISQSETGDALLGKVDSTLFGVQAGASFNSAKLMLGYNTVAEQADAFNNGAFLAPYSFSSSPLFTNNMLQTLENVDAGDAAKVTFFYYFPSVEMKLSYAKFNFASVVDREATCLDLIYNMNHYVKGLSLRYRVEVVTSDSNAVEQSDQRFQLQNVF